MSRLSAAISFTLLLALGCSADNPGANTREGDQELFANEVQPVLRSHCGFLGCHGREGMPLTLYTKDYLRLRDPDGNIDPKRTVLDERRLSMYELDHNRHALAARVGYDDPSGDIQRFLLRLIPAEAGGIPHANVAVFDSLDDPDLAKIRQFLETVQ